MKGELYRKCIVPASQTPSGEPAIVIVTEELNCFLVWLSSFDHHCILKQCPNRDAAIEWAVLQSEEATKELLYTSEPADL